MFVICDVKSGFIFIAGNSALIATKKEETITPSKRRGAAKAEEQLTGMVMYNGAMLDIESLLERLSKGEKSMTDYERKIRELEEDRGRNCGISA